MSTRIRTSVVSGFETVYSHKIRMDISNVHFSSYFVFVDTCGVKIEFLHNIFRLDIAPLYFHRCQNADFRKYVTSLFTADVTNLWRFSLLQTSFADVAALIFVSPYYENRNVFLCADRCAFFIDIQMLFSIICKLIYNIVAR